MSTDASGQGTDLSRVSRVVDIADIVAANEDASTEKVLEAALSKVRKRGVADE